MVIIQPEPVTINYTLQGSGRSKERDPMILSTTARHINDVVAGDIIVQDGEDWVVIGKTPSGTVTIVSAERQNRTISLLVGDTCRVPKPMQVPSSGQEIKQRKFIPGWLLHVSRSFDTVLQAHNWNDAHCAKSSGPRKSHVFALKYQGLGKHVIKTPAPYPGSFSEGPYYVLSFPQDTYGIYRGIDVEPGAYIGMNGRYGSTIAGARIATDAALLWTGHDVGDGVETSWHRIYDVNLLAPAIRPDVPPACITIEDEYGASPTVWMSDTGVVRMPKGCSYYLFHKPGGAK